MSVVFDHVFVSMKYKTPKMYICYISAGPPLEGPSGCEELGASQFNNASDMLSANVQLPSPWSLRYVLYRFANHKSKLGNYLLARPCTWSITSMWGDPDR